MKWGHIMDVDIDKRLLYWVLMFVLERHDDPVDHFLKDILKHDGGLGGDPGWEMEHVPSSDGPGVYRIWADPEMSGIEPAEAFYSMAIVTQALRESLLALQVVHPEKNREIQKTLNQYNL